jgi:hypothetical protein
LICEKIDVLCNYFTHVIMRFDITVQAKRALYKGLQMLQIDNYNWV